jgi:hypothetical protein
MGLQRVGDGKKSREVEGFEEEKRRYKRKGKGLANNDAKLLSTSSKVNCSIISIYS